MAHSKVLEQLKIKIAPYIRCCIVGEQNRLGRGALFEQKIDDSTYVLGGKQVKLEAQEEKDFFKIAAFVEKILRSEIGGANKTTDTLDTLAAEVLHALKFNSLSVEDNLHNVIEGEILRDPDFAEAAEAFFRLEEQSSLSNALSGSEIDGVKEVASYGEYGEIKNQIEADERLLNSINSNLSEQEKNKLKEQIKSSREKAIEIQTNFKQEAKKVLDTNAELLKSLKSRCGELMQIAKANEKGSEAYESAVAEMRQITEEYKELFASDRKYKKALEELRTLKKAQNEEMLETSQEIQKEI